MAVEEIINYRGRRNVNRRTWNMIEAAEKLAGFTFVITQGSYNSNVSASAGTHDGGGVVDIRARDLSPRKRGQVVLALRQVGFAAWLRTPGQSKRAPWPYHIHAVARGDRDLSKQAAAQIRSYRRARNGLKGDGPDDGPGGYYNMSWDLYRSLRQKAAKVNPGDSRPRNSLGQLCLSYEAIQYAGVHRSMNGNWGAYRNSAHRSIKALFPSRRNQPDTNFLDSWLFMERMIHRNPPSAVADPFSWYWFVGRCGFSRPDDDDWPDDPRKR